MTLSVKASPESVVYLNLGCGDTYFPEWNNCDLLPRRHIASVDLRHALPYADGAFDVVYSSHLLEHLTPADAKRLLGEIHRVLKPSGIFRIVVPDLEDICRNYLHYLEQAREGVDPQAGARYHWMLIELLDQMVRETSGGLMRETLREHRFDDEIADRRLGDSFMPHVDPDRETTTRLERSDITGLSRRRPDPLGVRLKRALIKWRLKLSMGPKDPRSTGEVHRWMYDSQSLKQALQQAGFTECSVVDFMTSRIPHWNKYNLDISRYGERARKPDSLYMESIKPA